MEIKMRIPQIIYDPIRELRLGDLVMTPNGIGFYQGRCYQGQQITRLIIKHQFDFLPDDQTGIELTPGQEAAVMLYPVEAVQVL